MIHPPELLDTLEKLPSSSLEVTAWRHMFGEHQPERENTSGARWNPPDVAAIYLSLTRDGAVAEGDHVVAVQAIPIRAQRVVYEIKLTLDNVIDLREPDVLARVGLDEHAIGGDDHAMCRQVGGATAWLERDGLLVPSARSGASNLVVFPAHRSADAAFTTCASELISSKNESSI